MTYDAWEYEYRQALKDFDITSMLKLMSYFKELIVERGVPIEFVDAVVWKLSINIAAQEIGESPEFLLCRGVRSKKDVESQQRELYYFDMEESEYE